MYSKKADLVKVYGIKIATELKKNGFCEFQNWKHPLHRWSDGFSKYSDQDQRWLTDKTEGMDMERVEHCNIQAEIGRTATGQQYALLTLILLNEKK